MNSCMQHLEDLYSDIEKILYEIKKKIKYDKEKILDRLQKIKDELGILFRTFGTDNIEDLINIVYGTDFLKNKKNYTPIYPLLNTYLHPNRI